MPFTERDNAAPAERTTTTAAMLTQSDNYAHGPIYELGRKIHEIITYVSTQLVILREQD